MVNRILIVEDEPDIGAYLVRGMTEEGLSVHLAADGEEAWRCLETGGWDVVLLDWQLPKSDGLSLLKRFRETDSETPVLFLTARDAVSDRVSGLNAGADDYLCKPFAFEELLARVRALTRRQKRQANNYISYGDLRSDLASHRVERANQRMILKAKEYSLLIFFMRHAEQVLNRPFIYEQVWEDQYDSRSNTLEVHVMELRRKLEAHGPRLIHTLRNRGYWFGVGAPPKLE